MEPGPSLAGAFARVDRAAVHINELDDALECVRKTGEDEVVAGQSTRLRKHAEEAFPLSGARVWFDKPPLPDFVSVLVGETVYNLRAALDYMVYELAWKDSGARKRGTQFPIEDRKFDPENPRRGFDGRRKKFLAGLSDLHVEAIEQLQPYSGAEWTRILRDISNPDKHRQLVRLTADAVSVGSYDYRPRGTADASRGVFTNLGIAGMEARVEFSRYLMVGLPEGGDLVGTLARLCREVRAVIDSFSREF